MQEYQNFVETPAASATPLTKQARRPSDQPRCKKRFAHLKEEMKRPSRIQQIYKELDRMSTVGEVEERCIY